MSVTHCHTLGSLSTTPPSEAKYQTRCLYLIVTKAPGPAPVVILKMRMKKKDLMRNLVCYCFLLQHSTTNSNSSIPCPESLYNDGKGIQVSVSLIGLLPQPKTGEKQCANAKPPVMTKVVYIHEKTTFVNGLTQIIVHTFKRHDLCRGGVNRDGNLKKKTSDLFSLAYTIPRTQLKDVEILSENDWGTFLEEAGKKPSAQGKLTIRERLVSLVSSLIPNYYLLQA